MSRSVKNSQPLDPQGFRFTGVRPQTEQPWPLAVASETKTISARPGLAGLAMKIPSGPLLPLLLVSLVGWLLLLTAHGNPMILPAICGVSSSRILAGVWPAIESVLLVTPATQLLLAWMLMLAAMMPPLLARPMERLWFAGTAGRRSSATALFLLAYFGVWTLAGVVLMATAVAVEVLANGARLSALVPAGLVAFIWQATPLKQVALNACHRPPRMTPDGLVAVRDSPRYGLSIALSCFGACWAFMLVPLVVHGPHCVAAMAICAVVLLLERRSAARPKRWRLPLAEAIRTTGRVAPAAIHVAHDLLLKSDSAARRAQKCLQ